MEVSIYIAWKNDWVNLTNLQKSGILKMKLRKDFDRDLKEWREFNKDIDKSRIISTG